MFRNHWRTIRRRAQWKAFYSLCCPILFRSHNAFRYPLEGSKNLSTSAETRWFYSRIILSATEKMPPAIIRQRSAIYYKYSDNGSIAANKRIIQNQQLPTILRALLIWHQDLSNLAYPMTSRNITAKVAGWNPQASGCCPGENRKSQETAFEASPLCLFRTMAPRRFGWVGSPNPAWGDSIVYNQKDQSQKQTDCLQECTYFDTFLNETRQLSISGSTEPVTAQCQCAIGYEGYRLSIEKE